MTTNAEKALAARTLAATIKPPGSPELDAPRRQSGNRANVWETDGLIVLTASWETVDRFWAGQQAPAQLLAYADALEEIERLRAACIAQAHEVTQTLGKALGYPWFKDDQVNFPGATEADGVCVGEHVAETLAMEAAGMIAELLARERQADGLAKLRAELEDDHK